VYRGTVVILLESAKAYDGNLVECFRLGRKARQTILRGSNTLERARGTLSHLVPQARFEANSRTEFNLDLQEDEIAVQRMMRLPRLDWDKWLAVSRGVEIGKKGLAIRCDSCGTYRVAPKSQIFRVRCTTCKRILNEKTASITKIVRLRTGRSTDSWDRLIVGEDVDRYDVVASREILTGLPGIKYKEQWQSGVPRLLVRKTGIGLRLALDRSGAYTT